MPTYLSNEKGPQRIATDLLYVKLNAILRNPVERAFSQYLVFQRDHNENSFEEAIEKRPSLLTDGLYIDHLKRYFKYFPKEQILILMYEDSKKNLLTSIKKILKYLEVDSEIIPSYLEKQT